MKALSWIWDHPALSALILASLAAVAVAVYTMPWMALPVAVAGLSMRKLHINSRREAERDTEAMTIAVDGMCRLYRSQHDAARREYEIYRDAVEAAKANSPQ